MFYKLFYRHYDSNRAFLHRLEMIYNKLGYREQFVIRGKKMLFCVYLVIFSE